MDENSMIVDPDICNGKPVIRGLRITVETVLGYLMAGGSIDEVSEQFPQLAPEDIEACRQFAAKQK